MAIRKIVTLSDSNAGVLRQHAKKVTRFDVSVERLVKDLWDTMHDAPGVGLAAPQIGVLLRVLVAEYEDESAVLINPEIVKSEGEEKGTEGCLSIPGYVGENISRATKITVRARNEHGKAIRITAEGWFARVLQHEIDHLDGILYTDRLDSKDDLRELRPGEEFEEEGAPTPHDDPSIPISTAS
jgi:peptide deformylase